jgi:broad specificity phosphatase PhoE
LTELILVRHPPVAKNWQGRCYGQSDAGLSREGSNMVPDLVRRLSVLQPDVIIHSGLARTRLVADVLARQMNLPIIAQPLWRERGFGAWEGQTWNAIYRATGNAMDGMMTDPAGFRPGDTGETTAEMVRRTLAAMREIPPGKRAAIISHGGPIAAAQMLANRLSFPELPGLIIPTASYIRIDPEAYERAAATPCIRLCELNAGTQICKGCLRTTDEIAHWGMLDQDAKLGLIDDIHTRKNCIA